MLHYSFHSCLKHKILNIRSLLNSFSFEKNLERDIIPFYCLLITHLRFVHRTTWIYNDYHEYHKRGIIMIKFFSRLYNHMQLLYCVNFYIFLQLSRNILFLIFHIGSFFILHIGPLPCRRILWISICLSIYLSTRSSIFCLHPLVCP